MPLKEENELKNTKWFKEFQEGFRFKPSRLADVHC